MDAALVLFMGFLFFAYLYWYGLRVTRDCCDYSCGGSFWGVCGVVVFCYITIFVLVLLISFHQIFDIDYTLRDSFASIAKYMMAVFLLMIWGFVQHAFLYQPYGRYRRLLARERNMHELELERRAGVNHSEAQISVALAVPRELTCGDKCIYFGNLAGNLILGLFFIAAEVVLFDELYDNERAGDWELFATEMYIALFILAMMAAFVPLSAAPFKQEDKQIYTVALAVFLPLLVIAYIYESVLSKNSTAQKLADLLTIVFPVFGLYLSTLHYVRRHSDNLYKAYLTVTGFGFVLPLSISYTMYYVNRWSITESLTIAGIVLFM